MTNDQFNPIKRLSDFVFISYSGNRYNMSTWETDFLFWYFIKRKLDKRKIDKCVAAAT